ncbi:hypothetical protein ACJX0J_020408, partial [Zea mays]
VGAQVVYSKYAGTELKFNDADHLILKDDIIGILDSDDVKDMKPLNDRILIKLLISSAGAIFLRPDTRNLRGIG